MKFEVNEKKPINSILPPSVQCIMTVFTVYNFPLTLKLFFCKLAKIFGMVASTNKEYGLSKCKHSQSKKLSKANEFHTTQEQKETSYFCLASRHALEKSLNSPTN